MKMCQPHWTALREAIATRGMEKLVARDGTQAVENLVLELEGREREAHFDPLMAAHNMIVGAAAGAVGLRLFTGEYCPVCEMLEALPPIPEGHRYASNLSYMIDGPADATLTIAQERGLMPPTPPTEAPHD